MGVSYRFMIDSFSPEKGSGTIIARDYPGKLQTTMQPKLVFALFAGLLILADSRILGGTTAGAQDKEPALPDGSGILDGMTFAGQIVRDGKPVVDVVDKWVFERGTFLSTECAVRCNYPLAPYFIREQGAKIEFISESRCTDQNATILWRGTIESGSIRGVKRWTVKRWYWTIIKEFEFEGSLTGLSNSAAATQ